MVSRRGEPVHDIVARVPLLAEASDLEVTPLEGGLSNTNYLVAADGSEFVVRVSGHTAGVLGVDRMQEEQAARRAAAAGIGPEVVAFLHPEGHAVTRFLAGAHPLTVDDFRAPATIRRVAARLRDIHDLEPIDGAHDPEADIERWLGIVEARRTPQPERLEQLLRRIAAGESIRAAGRSSRVLCHNDPYHLNFLDDGSLWVIDWEYAGMGYAMYDLAGAAYPLDSQGRDLLLECYFERDSYSKRPVLDASIDLYLGWNVVWSLVQVDDPAADFDYMNFAEGLLDLVL